MASAHEDTSLQISVSAPMSFEEALRDNSCESLRFATLDEFAAAHLANKLLSPRELLDKIHRDRNDRAKAEVETPYRAGADVHVQPIEAERILLSQEELLDKIAEDRNARTKAEIEAVYDAALTDLSNGQLANLNLHAKRMEAERMLTTHANTTIETIERRKGMRAHRSERLRTMRVARDAERHERMAEKAAIRIEAPTGRTTRIGMTPSNPLPAIMRTALLPIVWFVLLLRMAMRFVVMSYEYATGDTPQRRSDMEIHRKMVGRQNSSAERARDGTTTTTIAPRTIARDPRIVDLIARAEVLLASEPDLADGGGARIDDLVRTHLPRLEERRRRVLELGAPSAVADAETMVEKALTTGEISLAQAIEIASRIHLDDLGTEVRFLDMRTPDDGSNPQIAPLPAVAPKKAAARREQNDVESRNQTGPMMVGHYDHADPSDYDCGSSGGGGSSDW